MVMVAGHSSWRWSGNGDATGGRRGRGPKALEGGSGPKRPRSSESQATRPTGPHGAADPKHVDPDQGRPNLTCGDWNPLLLAKIDRA
jgi:hypothetical protein